MLNVSNSSFGDKPYLKLGKNLINDEEINLSKFVSSEDWDSSEYYCFQVTAKVMPFKKSHTRAFIFDWMNRKRHESSLKNEDISWIKVYVTSKDNVYGKSFMNRWHDGQVFKEYIIPGEYRAISLTVIIHKGLVIFINSLPKS